MCRRNVYEYQVRRNCKCGKLNIYLMATDGCEERNPNEAPKVSVTLINEDNEEKIISVEDQWLIENNLDEGDEWSYLALSEE